MSVIRELLGALVFRVLGLLEVLVHPYGVLLGEGHVELVVLGTGALVLTEKELVFD